jgi:tRNA guanosine-2'-O-methyltransferase
MPKNSANVQVLHDLPINLKVIEAAEATSAPFQTKSGFDLTSLLPHPGLPSSVQRRPASVILIASLIDNPTNLGGLSRIAESFGLEALYIDSLKAVETREFKNTAVTSYKHLDIKELKVHAVPGCLLRFKEEGWEVVGVEQTDRSGILGEDAQGSQEGVVAGDYECAGTLPRKCVLVLGSEKGGITSEILAVVDRCVEIRTVGVTRSLNVQTAGGIALYEWWREWGGRL